MTNDDFNLTNKNDIGRNSIQKKRLSWGKSKVLEFYKDTNEEGKNIDTDR